MKKLFTSFAVVVAAVVSQACATGAGYTGFTGLSFPGYEAAGVVAGNQALIGAIASQSFYGAPYGYGAVPVCRLQDLRGLPPVGQPMIVRVDKTRRHRTADIVGAAVVGAGLGGLSAGWQGAAYGGAAGGGGGLFVSNHEQDLCLALPVPKP